MNQASEEIIVIKDKFSVDLNKNSLRVINGMKLLPMDESIALNSEEDEFLNSCIPGSNIVVR